MGTVRGVPAPVLVDDRAYVGTRASEDRMIPLMFLLGMLCGIFVYRAWYEEPRK
jgi:hypothetical protein